MKIPFNANFLHFHVSSKITYRVSLRLYQHQTEHVIVSDKLMAQRMQLMGPYRLQDQFLLNRFLIKLN
jgi:hypothetical protein